MKEAASVPDATEQPRTGRARLDEVQDVIHQRLADKTYGPGAVLPSHRQLAAEFNVSHATIAAALKPYKDTGIVCVRKSRKMVVVGSLDTVTIPQGQVARRRAEKADARNEVIDGIRRVIRERIASGQYGLESLLPEQSELRCEFHASEEVMRAALKPLQDDGTLCFVRGHGMYVADPKKGPRSGKAAVEHTVRQRVADGTYAPLTWLPTLLILAGEFGVSLTTVSLGLAPLKGEKLVGTASYMTYVIGPSDPAALPDTPSPHPGQELGRSHNAGSRKNSVRTSPTDTSRAKTSGHHGPGRHGMQEAHA
ncbi:GntR family transcriptional regulator [Streptomyces sp. NPDC020707]|uniref:GntR family transcriptional regulator n=1 Tax=Streptomyces sp. NPDC020707 TaxID=3365084 RepID=UPI0037B4B5D3